MQLEEYFIYAGYTYVDAKRTLDKSSEILRTFYGEIPHTLQLVGGVKFWDNWSFSSRIDYHSGTPFTKVEEVLIDNTNPSNPRYIPIFSDPLAARLSDYFSLNLKISQLMRLGKKQSLEWSFEIMNATNHDNVISARYGQGYVPTYALQLPLLPWFDLTYRF